MLLYRSPAPRVEDAIHQLRRAREAAVLLRERSALPDTARGVMRSLEIGAELRRFVFEVARAPSP